MREVLIILAILLPSAFVLGYFIKCASRGKWLTLREWWKDSPKSLKPPPLPNFDDPRVVSVYVILCDTLTIPPPGEHWEGHTARRIVAALFPPDGE